MGRPRLSPLVLAACLVTPLFARADVAPLLLPVQGRLLGADDAPVSGEKSLTFSLHELAAPPPAGSGTPDEPVFSETKTVQLSQGLYSALLGTDTVLDASKLSGELYLGVKVDGVELLPRLRIGSTPFALAAERAGLADVAKSLDCAGCVAGSMVAAGAITSAHLSGTGEGSGFDADKLDGLDSGAFRKASDKVAFSELDGIASAEQLPNIPAEKLPNIPADKLPAFDASMIPSLPVSKVNATELEAFVRANSLTSVQTERGTTLPSCGAQQQGLLFFQSSTTGPGTFWGCNGSSWIQLFGSPEAPETAPSTLPRSCKAIKSANPRALDGQYFVDFDNNPATAPAHVYCDMTRDGGGWMLILSNVSGTLQKLNQAQKTEALTPMIAGVQKEALDMIKHLSTVGGDSTGEGSLEIRYTDTRGVTFLEAWVDGPEYERALKQSTSQAVPVRYKTGALSGVLRYIEVNQNYHWGHRNNQCTNAGKTTCANDLYGGTLIHVCWEDVHVADRPFASDHASGAAASFCPGVAPTYDFGKDATRGGSFRFHKWVR